MTTTTRPAVISRAALRPSYGVQISWLLVAAFTLSAVHTGYSWIAGIDDPTFTVTTPLAWIFYAVAFGAAAMARSRSRGAQWVLAAFLVALLCIAMLVYPSMFGPAQQTPFGWIENDVYVGLLVTCLYLTVQRLRRFDLVAEQVDR